MLTIAILVKLTVVGSGALLIIAGVLLSFVQMRHELRTGAQPHARSVEIGPKSAKASTTYVGVILVVVGAVLEMTGTVVG